MSLCVKSIPKEYRSAGVVIPDRVVEQLLHNASADNTVMPILSNNIPRIHLGTYISISTCNTKMVKSLRFDPSRPTSSATKSVTNLPGSSSTSKPFACQETRTDSVQGTGGDDQRPCVVDTSHNDIDASGSKF